MLRYLLEMPLQEEQDLQEDGGQRVAMSTKAEAALEKTVKPALPDISLAKLCVRMDPSTSVVITCGNPWSMEDIKYAAETTGLRFGKED